MTAAVLSILDAKIPLAGRAFALTIVATLAFVVGLHGMLAAWVLQHRPEAPPEQPPVRAEVRRFDVPALVPVSARSVPRLMKRLKRVPAPEVRRPGAVTSRAPSAEQEIALPSGPRKPRPSRQIAGAPGAPVVKSAMPSAVPVQQAQLKPDTGVNVKPTTQASAMPSSASRSRPAAKRETLTATTASAAAAHMSPARLDAAQLHKSPLEFPAMSREAGEEGTVLLLVRVSESGRTDQVQVAQSSGYSRLDEAALNSVRQWRFIPARHGSRPVAESVMVPVNFRLEG